MPAKRLIAYYRVSTRQQGESGLGLDAQEAAVKAYAATQAGEVLTAYTEVESGKRADRPELAKAIAHAKRSRAVLVVAKLDRLARNVMFLSTLMESGVAFVACDQPAASRLTIHILAAVAEEEARAISSRTKAALAQAKRRGVKLGSARPGHWKGREAARRRGAEAGNARSAEVRRRQSVERMSDLLPDLLARRQAGATFQQLADHLNAAGQSSARGGKWYMSTVRALILRAGG